MAAVPPRTSLRSPLRAAARCARRWLIDDLSPLPRRCAAPLRAARRGATLCEWCPLRHRAAQWASGRGLRKRRRELRLEEATSRG